MKKQILLAGVIALATAVGVNARDVIDSNTAQTSDKRPLLYPHSLDQLDFNKAGLWFWETQAPQTNIWVEYVKGNEDKSVQRTFICVGKLGTTVAIYCVNAPTERDDTLMLLAFLAGYKASQAHLVAN